MQGKQDCSAHVSYTSKYTAKLSFETT